jgi:hypothetical protein
VRISPGQKGCRKTTEQARELAVLMTMRAGETRARARATQRSLPARRPSIQDLFDRLVDIEAG